MLRFPAAHLPLALLRRFAAWLLPLALLLASSPASAQTWQLFATATTAKVFFDRASVREEDGYVHYQWRIEYIAPRDSSDRKYQYSSSVSGQAGQCEARKVALKSVARFDVGGRRLTETALNPDRWQQAFVDVGVDGLQARLLKHACALARGASPSPPVTHSATTSIGAGIVVSADGLILTNHHVAQDCDSISVLEGGHERARATVLGTDLGNDLALLRTERTFPAAATFRRAAPLQAGEAVTVVGYPLANILGFEPNVAFGYVSATGGLRGDSTRFQISAPIHKGNSGGPILDQGGQVIGIVTSKLDALAVQKRTGDLPQNISFGVRGEVAQTFLERNSAAFRSGAAGAKLENTEVAAIGRAITVLVACRKSAAAAAK